MIKFTHLNVHTEYSIIDGIIKIGKLLQIYNKLGIKSISITDILTIASFPEYYEYSLKKKIKPIIGTECFLLINGKILNLILIAKNYLGYLKLIKIISNAWRYGNIENGVFLKLHWLYKFKNKLIVIINLRYYLLESFFNFCEFSIFIKELTINYNNNFYFEINRINLSLEELINNKIIYFSKLFNIKLVATNSVKFIFKKDFPINLSKILICQNKIFEEKLFFDYSNQQYIKTYKDMKKLFFDILESIENINLIILNCNVLFNFYKFNLPKIKISNFKIRKKIFDNLVKAGLKKRIKKKNKQIKIYLNRVNKEVLLTKKLGLIDYYLIITEFIFWTRKKNIISGPGRGSGSSSLLCYSLYITDIDPINENLLFERFFSSERLGIPDLDLDFCVLERDNIISHLYNYYGYNNISQIVTFHTVSAKSSIRDLSRAIGMDYISGERFSRSVPFSIELSMEHIFRENISVRSYISKNHKCFEIWKISSKLEGIARNISKHAGGVVICNTGLNNFTPILFDENECMTHYEKIILQDIGLIKFDFLGLKTLSTISLTLKMISEKNTGEFFIDDYHTFQMINNLDTELIFQLESYGIKKIIKKLPIENIFDLINLLSLYRPGPIQSGFINDFINRKNNIVKTYHPYSDCDFLQSKIILANTHGMILFQEQVLQLILFYTKCSNYDSEKIYASMIKKSKIKLKISKLIFINECNKLGIDKKTSSKFFNIIEKFASYSFNKTHAHSYSKIVYQTAYLKSNYLLEYCLSNIYVDQLLGIDINNIINIIKSISVFFYKPDINLSDENFKIYKKGILYGFDIVTFIDENFIDKVIYYRNKLFYYNNFEMFCKIFSVFKIKKKKIIENLIFSGFFDCFKINRVILFVNFQFIFENILTLNNEYSRTITYKFVRYFNYAKKFFLFKKILTISSINILNIEKKILKFYTSFYPLVFYSLKLIGHKNFNLFKRIELNNFNILIAYGKSKKNEKKKAYFIGYKETILKFYKFSFRTILPWNNINVIFFLKYDFKKNKHFIIHCFRIKPFLKTIGSILVIEINCNIFFLYNFVKKIFNFYSFYGEKIYFLIKIKKKKKILDLKININLNDIFFQYLKTINIKRIFYLNSCK
ncbi:DNA polymerase III alpha subunit [Candidatus Carsonella ruddii PV]|uniref:DNA polymerase III subunit alpha n=1 Tax=Carsonella ruddii (strain PV) TaxID=387662 RepID=Q05FW7_CARRP|nr:DNA polymerase III subunit alpha [Candidatus Carsonella ruddii]BAF35054.1 DNA polymerase III alpha subunit [Candidatus Carsonella ruddii PV]